MPIKLRRPFRGTVRPQFAAGGAARAPGAAPALPAAAGPRPGEQRADKALRNAGVDRPSPGQRAHVERVAAEAAARSLPATADGVGPAAARALQMGGSSGGIPQPGSDVPSHIQAALDSRPTFARGGAVGLPASPFAPVPTPAVPTPGLANPRGLVGARHRQRFASGGAALPLHILAALAARPHFDDGGNAGGNSGNAGGGGSDGGDHGGSGGSGEAGGGTGNGSDRGGSGSDGPSGSAGGPGGFGGGYGGSDGYGGGNGAAPSGSAGGVGGFGGSVGGTDGYGRSAGTSDAAPGSAGVAGGQIAGSAPAAPAAGSFSAAPATGGFAGPVSNDGAGYGMGGISGPASEGSLSAQTGFGSFGQAYGRATSDGYAGGPTTNEAMRSAGDAPGAGDDGLGMPSGWTGAGSAPSAPPAASVGDTAPIGAFSQPGQIAGSAPTLSAGAFAGFGEVPGYTGYEALNGSVASVNAKNAQVGDLSQVDALGTAVTPNAQFTPGVLSPDPVIGSFNQINPYTGNYFGMGPPNESGFQNPDTDTAFGVSAEPGAVQSLPDRLSPNAVAGLNGLQSLPGREGLPGVHAFGGNLDQGPDARGMGGMDGTAPGTRSFDRYSYASGGAARSGLPASIAAALAARPRFSDGGSADPSWFGDGSQPASGPGFSPFGGPGTPDPNRADGGQGFAGFSGPGTPDPSSGDGGQSFGDAGRQSGAGQTWGIGGDSPDGPPATQPTITASLPGTALPSASRDPSGLLQNGTDTTALNTFWSGRAGTPLPSPQWSDRRAGITPPPATAQAAASTAPAQATAAPAMAAAPAPQLYNPMADPLVRSSLHLATGGRARFDDGGLVGANALLGDPTDYTPQAPLPAAAATAASLSSGHALDDYARSVDPSGGWQPGLASAPGLVARTADAIHGVATDPAGAAAGVARGVGSSIYSGATLPGDALQGKVDPTDVSVLPRVFDMVGLMSGAGLPMAEEGAAGAMGGRLASMTPDATPLSAGTHFAKVGKNIVERFSNGYGDVDYTTYGAAAYRRGDKSDPLASMSLSQHPDGRYEVGSVEVDPDRRRQGLATALYQHVADNLGVEMQPSGQLLPDGYAFWQNRDPGAVQYHRQIGGPDGTYLSPKQLQAMTTEPTFLGPAPYQAAFDALPPEAKTPEALAAMFSRGIPIPGAESTDSRSGYTSGGRARLPDTIADALRLRPHLDDGGNAGGNNGESGGDHGGSNGGNGENGGSDHGGTAGNAGGGSDGNGGNGTSGQASGAGGGVGGFGGGAGGSDGYGGVGNGGGGGHSDASTGNANGSAAGVGSSGSSDRGSAPSGGQSDAASGAANGSSAGLGSAPSSGASATSGAVGSIGGSVGAPSAGGFSSEGAPSTGGFGGFGAGPAANSNPAGLSGGTPTSSSLDGRTATQQASAEAAAGAAGEDGTTSAGAPGGLTTGQAFASFGPSATVGAFGAPSAGMQGYGAVSPNVGTFSGFGADGVTPGAMAGLGVGPAGVLGGMPAYGLSTNNLAGFDNFNTAGQVASTSIGPDGYTGGYGGGIQDAINNSLADADSFANAHPGLPGYGPADSFSPDYSGFHLGADGKPDLAAQGAQQAASLGELGASLRGLGAFGTGAGVTPGSPVSTTPTGTTPGLNADGDPASVNGVSALTIHGTRSDAVYGGYDAPGPVAPFGGITDAQAFNARQNIIAGTGTLADSAITSGYVAQQNSPVGPTLGLGAMPAAAPVATTTGPAVAAPAVTAAVTPTATTTDPTATQSIDPTSTGWSFSVYNKAVQSIEDPTGVATNAKTKAFGSYQMTPGTWGGLRNNYPGLGLPAHAEDATPAQMEAAQNALTGEDLGALAKAGLPGTMVNAYATHLLGAPVGVAALSAPDSTPIGNVVGADAIANNQGLLARGVQTVGDMKSRIGSMLARSGVDPSSTAASTPSTPAGYAAMGLGVAPAAGTFSADGVSYGTAPGVDPSVGAPGLGPLTVSPAPAPAPAPITRTVSTPTPYASTPAEASAMTDSGYEATPANAYAVHTLGPEAAYAATSLPGDTPIGEAGIAPSVQQANPGLFSGVQTVGQLRANIAGAAATAGPPSVSTVTEPGVPSAPAPSAPAATPSEFPTVGGPPASTPWGGDLGSYRGVDGTDTGFGLGAIAAGVPQTINNAGTLGVPSGVGVSQAEQNFAGLSQVPSSLPSFARGLGAAPGFSASDGFSATPSTAAPGATPSTTTGQPDTSTTAHPSVPAGITNTAANVGLSVLGGPIGAGLAAVNGISGLVGGPTIGSMLNGVLAGSSGGAPVSAGGQGDNGSGGNREGGYSTMPAYYGPSASDGSSTSSTPTPSSGFSPLDPHADAEAAYQAAMAGMHRGTAGTGAGSARGDGAFSGHAHPLTVHRLSFASAIPRVPSTYDPLQDPSVRHALGLDN